MIVHAEYGDTLTSFTFYENDINFFRAAVLSERDKIRFSFQGGLNREDIIGTRYEDYFGPLQKVE